ncbi:hypothetical protein IW261DRAFT_1443515 [Armillaria novae-zelandiae]|uniref:Uncharacterized protein n=1 Tax=Armillaria novae-zelandiae TaxID=153914 RepID=A0AA39PRR4_9AGAR|nr:hypothetical protein IW261DRAFT_1443515 [Armillaria novae-zelandiae]
MAIAPITGMLRKRFIVDLTCSLSLGTAGAYAFWYGYHLKAGTLIRPFLFCFDIRVIDWCLVENHENFYLQLEKAKLANRQ